MSTSATSPRRRFIAIGIAMAILGAGVVPTTAAAGAATESTDYTALVNTFVSTEDDFGQDLPGAEAPNSIIKINPMTAPGRSHSGYDYAEDQISGFTHTNLDGVGGSGGGGDLLVVPTYASYSERPATNTYPKNYTHDGEEAEPGYYRVDLASDQGAIRAEATTDVRTGQDRFTFPEAGTASLVVDLNNNFTRRNGATLEVAELPDGRATLSGEFGGHFNGYDYTMYYYVETTTPAARVRTWSGAGALEGVTTRSGGDIGAVLEFNVEAGEQVGLKVAISPISAEQAKADMAAEMGERSFEHVRHQTHDAWNEILGRIAVTASEQSDPDGELQTLFYTHLYRMFGMPMNATSTSGTYRGLDGEIYPADGYTHYDGWGFWDDFRKYEILAIGYPDVFRDIAQSIVDLYASFAQSGKGSLSQTVHSVPTVRFERAAVVVADAVAKGAELRGLSQAWPALVSQSQGGYDNADNERRGYIANEVDDTLGTSYDDWAMATIADALGKTDEAQNYRLRAANWTNLFKDDAVTLADGTKTGLIFPKNADGAWNNADPERFEAGNVYQGTLWQYHWYAASDMGGLIAKMGGEDTAAKALSFMFGEHAPDDGSRMLHSNANEIDLQAPYLFNYVGEPAKTQYWVRSIYTKETWNRYIATGSTHEKPSNGGEFTPPQKTKVYKNDPQGFLPTMDNDTGTMSATFVAAAMGLFPVLAGSDEYQIGSPFFENVRITYPSGRTFDIAADGVSADAFYIQSANLNGESFDRTWVTYDQLTAGGKIEFQMGENASEWAADGVASSSLSDELPSNIYDPISALSVASRTFTESATGDGTIGNSVEMNLSNGTFAGSNGDDLAAAFTVENLPEGLSLKAERIGNRVVRLSLVGAVAQAEELDSIDDLVLTATDAAFSRKPAAGSREFTFRIDFAGAVVHADTTGVTASNEGNVDGSITLTLSGARFAGAAGQDLVADGAVQFPGLPDSIGARAILGDDRNLTVSLSGTLGEAQRAEFSVAFADAAFDGVSAESVQGAGTTGLRTLRIERDQQWRAQLEELLAEAERVVRGAYSSSSFAAFDAAREDARTVLAQETASDDELSGALKTLRRSGAALTIAETAYRLFQAEDFEDSSGGRLAPETGNDAAGGQVGAIGGVSAGSWIAYDAVDFAGTLPLRVKLRYANHPDDSATQEYVEVRVGAVDGPVAARVELELTTGWNDFTTSEALISDPALLDGSNRLYFVFGGTPTPGQPSSWIVNLDWAQFLKTDEDAAEPLKPVRVEAEDYTADNGNGLKKEGGEAPAGNVGGTWDGGQLTYAERDFGAGELTRVTVSAATRDDRVGDNRRLEFYLDEVAEGHLIGAVALPKTGGWANYVETTAELDAPLSGEHALIVVMRADAVDGQEFAYVANLQWYEFSSPQAEADLSALQAAIDEAQPVLAEEDRYISFDFAVFRAAVEEAIRVAALPGATQDQADEARRVLGLARAQLALTVPEEPVELNITVETTTRIVAGKQYVSVLATNNADVAVDVVVDTAYGSKSFPAVAPGKSVSVLINSRQVSIPAGEVMVTATTADGTATVSHPAAYPAAG